MVILEQSPWYQEILKKGEERGKREELLSSLELMLEMKFGEEGLKLMPLISPITDLQKLREIRLAIKNVSSLDELRQILTPQE